jgi:hypothetical protein
MTEEIFGANKLVQVVAFLTCIRELSGSNLHPDTDCRYMFRGFSRFLQANAMIATLRMPRSLLLT